MTKSKIKNLLIAIFFVSLFALGIFFTSKDLLLVFQGVKTQGIVTESYCATTCAHVVLEISFKDSYGQKQVITNVSSLEPTYSKGDFVTIYYDSNNPKNAVDVSVFTFVLPFFFLALLILTVLVINSFLKKK